jgi:ABC-type bacteriocin/lantibiotic exporter with double-glycine peptidase domain
MENHNYNFNKLKKIISLERSEILSIYFYAILSGLIQLSLPLGIQTILGFVLGATMVTSVYLLIFVIIVAVFFVGFLQINQMKIIEKIQQKIFVRYAFEFAEKIPKLDLKEIDNYYLPEKTNRFFETLNIQKSISKLLLDIPIALIQILFGLILISFYHPLFIMFSFILVFIIWIIFKFTSKKGLITSIEESNNKYSIVSWFEEIGRVIKSFKYSQGTNFNLLKTDRLLLKYIQSRTSHFKILLIQFQTFVFFKVSITALMLILGTYLLFNQKINIGQFVAAEIVIITILNALEKLIVSLENLYDMTTGLYKIDSILELPEDEDGFHILDTDSLSIEVKKLGFSYKNRAKIFENLSFDFIPNSINIISGNENSGKSTLLKLFTGGYKNYEGDIYFNKISLKSYNLQSLRANTGVFLNDLDIFEGTLLENISLGRNSVNEDKIMELCKKIGFFDFTSYFPNAFETKINPLGKNLPTSLIKKILLLRSLINMPILLILEEPWLGLDENAQKGIQDYLERISLESTIVISTNDNEYINKSNFNIINLTNLKK